MSSNTRPTSKDLLPMHSSNNQPPTRTLRRLSHGLVMELKQAVQLEKQELMKMGLTIEADMTQFKVLSSPEDDNQSHEGLTLPHWLNSHQRVVRPGKYGGCFPCSPPVPIPQNHDAQRRYSATYGLEEAVTHGIDTDQIQPMSTSHCKAKIFDEYWNLKISTDCRESLVVSTDQVNESAMNNNQSVDEMSQKLALLKSTSESCMTLTVKNVSDDYDNFDEVVGPEEEEYTSLYGDVFVMEDL